MVALFFCILFLYIPTMDLIQLISKSSDNYGPYNLAHLTTEQCRGPKSTNLTKMTCNLVKNEDNTTTGYFRYEFPNATEFEEMRSLVYTIKNGNKITLWNYRIADPCAHFVIGIILNTQLHAENCVVKKGIYTFEINVSEMTQKFYGSSFFYGDYIFKAIAFSKKGNIGCIIFHHTFEKKK